MPLEAATTHFCETFHREMTEEDRFFYWSSVYSDEEFKNLNIKIMIDAGIPESHIYAYEKTGLMVTEEGYKNLSIKDKKALHKAGKEHDKHPNKGRIYNKADYDSDWLEPDGSFTIALYIFSQFVEKNINSGQKPLGYERFISGYLVVRAYRLLRCIFRSKKYSTSEENLALIRSIYEIYCKLVFSSRSEANAKYLVDSDFGLIIGTHEILTKNGKKRRNILVDKETKQEIPRFVSFLSLIQDFSI